MGLQTLRDGLVARAPWNEDYLNPDFHPMEVKRLQKATAWYKEFQRLPDGTATGPVDGFYAECVPDTVLLTQAHANQCNLGAFAFFLDHDGPRVPVLTHQDRPTPKPGFPFRIVTAHVFRLATRTGREKVLYVDEWEPMDPLEIYVDTEFDGPDLMKHFHDNLDLEDVERTALAWSTFGSPDVGGRGGGIAVQGYMRGTRGNHVKRFFDDLQFLLPPPMWSKRMHSTSQLMDEANGLALRLTTKAPRSSHRYWAQQPPDSLQFLDAVRAARAKPGEPSFFGSIRHEATTRRQEFFNLLGDYQASDLGYPYDVADSLLAERGEALVRSIDDRYWATYARLRLTPIAMGAVGDHADTVLQRLLTDYGAALETWIPKLPRGYDEHVRFATPTLRTSLLRNAFSSARARGAIELDARDLEVARKQVRDSFSAFIERPEVRSIYLDHIARMPTALSDRYAVTLAAIRAEPGQTINDLWPKVKDEVGADGKPLFSSIGDFQGILDFGRDKGYWSRRNNRYYRQ